MIRVTFLGTSASRPTVGRNVGAIAVQREGDFFLFDCGEGTQRQMMRYGTGFGLSHIFVTHLHADHFLGIIGLVRTLSLQDRTEPVRIYGPEGAAATLENAVGLGGNRTSFPVAVSELKAGDTIDWEEFSVEAVPVSHGVSALGYALREHPRLGRFDVDAARRLGVPEGPLFGELHRGREIEVNGRTIRPSDVVGVPRPGRLVVYTGDTRPCESVVERSAGADLLIHESTFGDDGTARAMETFHSTAREAADVARRAGAKRLLLTHISARYSANPGPLEQEARQVFSAVEVARDGQVAEVGYRADPEPAG